MDDADWHLRDLRKKHLAVDEITVYNHMAIYLRWCLEHGLMSDTFCAESKEVQHISIGHDSGGELRILLQKAARRKAGYVVSG